MASSPSPKAPSFVFEYLPKKATTKSMATDTTSPSIYDQTSSFLSSITKTLAPNPRLSVNEQRHATLAQVKAGLESYVGAKQTAGIAVSANEMDDLMRIERALQGLGSDA